MANQLSAQAVKDIQTFRSGVFAALVLYVILVLLNAISVLAMFWLMAFKVVHVPWQVLGAWAVGTGGLGAGSLIFTSILPHLFAPQALGD